MFFSGNSDVDEYRRQLVVDNTFDGFDLFSTNEAQWVRTFVVPPPTVRYPKQVMFGESGSIVVGGSDHGLVRVFETKSGDLIDVLRHAEDGMVQTIAVIGFITVCMYSRIDYSVDPHGRPEFLHHCSKLRPDEVWGDNHMDTHSTEATITSSFQPIDSRSPGPANFILLRLCNTQDTLWTSHISFAGTVFP